MNRYSNPSWIFSTVLHLFQGHSSSKNRSSSLLTSFKEVQYLLLEVALIIIIGCNFFFQHTSNRITRYFIVYQRRFNLSNEISQQCKRNSRRKMSAHIKVALLKELREWYFWRYSLWSWLYINNMYLAQSFNLSKVHLICNSWSDNWPFSYYVFSSYSSRTNKLELLIWTSSFPYSETQMK